MVTKQEPLSLKDPRVIAILEQDRVDTVSVVLEYGKRYSRNFEVMSVVDHLQQWWNQKSKDPVKGK